LEVLWLSSEAELLGGGSSENATSYRIDGAPGWKPPAPTGIRDVNVLDRINLRMFGQR
jgi:hypothetical protein